MNNVKRKIKSIAKSSVSLLKAKQKIPIYQTSDSLLKNKIALISGGCGGIGMAIAKEFIKSGCKVIISGTNEEKCKRSCEILGNNTKYIILDINQVNNLKSKIDEAKNVFGKIDIYVNSVGVHTVRPNFNFLTITEKEYDEVMSINLKGTYFICQEISKYMIESKIKGHILIISSQSALEPAWSPYRLSKWGIKGLTAGMAQQLISYGIIVNAIAPGPTATSMQNFKSGESIQTFQNPIERYTTPEEIAQYAKMLCSDLGNTIVGDTLYMSGGRGIIEIR